MSSEMTFPSALVFTLTALVGFVSTVDEEMGLELTNILKLLVADITLMPPDVQVHRVQMCSQHTLATESFVAGETLVDGG